jgi:4-amino-4-deoxy-L-arabinose transferase-like glycosyltransferase
MLTKGLVIYAFLLPGIVAIRLIRGRHGRLYNLWPWVGSLGIFLCWAVCGAIFVPGFYDQVVVREFLGRFGETIHRPQPLLFYFPHLLHKFLPWSVLMIGLAMVELHVRNWKIRDALSQISAETLWLVCWIFGGLIVMSIIPSKRVDRIFPIIPPLCLLLAAQLGHILSNESTGQRLLRWSTAALLFSIAFTGAYSEFKIYTGYRDHRDALVRFGRVVREESERNHWRYAVVKSGDEGLLLYLDKTHFIDPGSAITEWNRGNLDAIVVPEKTAPDLMRDLDGAALLQLRSLPRKESAGRYVVIGH